MHRRDLLAVARGRAAAGLVPRIGRAGPDDLYDIEPFGNVRVLHHDRHATRSFCRSISASRAPISASARWRASRRIWSASASSSISACSPPAAPPTLSPISISRKPRTATAASAASRISRPLIDRLRAEAGAANTVLLDGGDLWQGTGLANIMQGADMVELGNMLGIEAMTAHWEFTYGEAQSCAEPGRVQGRLHRAERVPDRRGRVQQCAQLRSGIRPRVPPLRSRKSAGAASPSSARPFPTSRSRIRSVSSPNWTFGIRDAELQKVVDRAARARTTPMRSSCCRITAWMSI